MSRDDLRVLTDAELDAERAAARAAYDEARARVATVPCYSDFVGNPGDRLVTDAVSPDEIAFQTAKGRCIRAAREKYARTYGPTLREYYGR